jgi:hypothetical protein
MLEVVGKNMKSAMGMQAHGAAAAVRRSSIVTSR